MKFNESTNKYSKMAHQLIGEDGLETEKFVLIARARQFSNESIHRPGEVVDACVESVWFELQLSLYANGINNESQGYVSLCLRVNSYHSLPTYKCSEFCCIVSVIDSSGNKRFLRSFAFPHFHEWRTHIGKPTFDINRYIKRETLLADTLDLLPEDCLSLHIDATFHTSSSDAIFDVHRAINRSFTSVKCHNEIKHCLFLGSAVAERLKEVSTYFQRMSESAMEEKRTGYVNLPTDEYMPFRLVCDIVLGSNAINVDSIHEICLMYTVADKYDIPVAIETCRRLMISFLCVKNDETIVEHVDQSIPEMLELAETFNDVRLKEIVERFLKYKKEGIENGNRTWEDKQDNLESEWEVRFLGRISDICVGVKENSLLFDLWKDARVKKYRDKPEFQFYQ